MIGLQIRIDPKYEEIIPHINSEHGLTMKRKDFKTCDFIVISYNHRVGIISSKCIIKDYKVYEEFSLSDMESSSRYSNDSEVGLQFGVLPRHHDNGLESIGIRYNNRLESFDLFSLDFNELTYQLRKSENKKLLSRQLITLDKADQAITHFLNQYKGKGYNFEGNFYNQLKIWNKFGSLCLLVRDMEGVSSGINSTFSFLSSSIKK